MIRKAILAVALVSCASCEHSTLRGTFAATQDHKTYLAIVDDNGGHCGPIKVDGKVWPYAIGQAGQVEPGTHTIWCGGTIQFDIPEGVVFKFNYWGP